MGDHRRNKMCIATKSLIERLSTESQSTVIGTLAKIKNICSKRQGIREFSDSGGIKPLLGLIEKPKLSEISLSVLANCCLDEEVRNQVILFNGVASIVRLFKCLASESIRNRACRALANLGMSPRALKVLHKEEIASLIVKFLAETKQSASQQTAVRAIRILSYGLLYRQEFIEQEAVFHISNLMNSKNIDVLEGALKTLSALTENCSIECAQQIHRSQCLSKIIELCSQEEHKSQKENAFITIINLTSQSLIRPELGNAGVIPLLIKAIENNEMLNPNPASLILALCFCCREAINRNRIRDGDGLKTLLATLRQQKHSKNLQEKVVCSLLAYRFDKASLDVLIELGLIEVLIQQLIHFISENKREHNLKSDEFSCINGNSYPDNKIITSNETFEQLKEDPGNEDDRDKGVDEKKKVFCIHSPSYRLVQNEADVVRTFQRHRESYSSVSADFPGPFSLISRERSTSPIDSTSQLSSLSPWSCLSPSTSSPNWSPIWSGSICSSPGSSSSLDEVGSNASHGHYSPACGDFSGLEDNDSMCKNIGAKECASNSVKSEPRRNFIRRTKRRSSESWSGAQSPSSDNSKLGEPSTIIPSLSKKFKHIPKEPKEDETVGGHIIHMLSHLSHTEKHSGSLITESCIKTLMDYMCCLATPSLRAERILIRLFKNYDSFESLISFGMISLINKHLPLKHSLDNCTSCKRLQNSKQRLLSSLSLVAESGYGVGVLSHILYTGQTSEIATCILTIPYLVKGHYQLRKLLCDCGGLSQLLQLLESNQSLEALESLSVLCRTFFAAPKVNSCSNEKSETSTKSCCFNASDLNTKFLLDDGSVILANRKILCHKSSFFSAMLEGSFVESSSNKIKLPDVSAAALNLILHYFADCSIKCDQFKNLEIKASIELVSLCDRFLLDDLFKVIEPLLVSKLNPESVKQFYYQAISYECEALSTAILKYVLTGNMSTTQRNQCFQDMRNTQLSANASSGDIQKTITSFVHTQLKVDLLNMSKKEQESTTSLDAFDEIVLQDDGVAGEF